MNPIIAPTDFSTVSLNAVNYAADMAQDINAELVLMHADDFFVSTSDISFTPISTYAENNSAERLKNLREKLIERTNNKINIRTESIEGSIFNEIENVCNREQPFAVVMATHSPSTVERLILKSVTLYATKHIRYPVLIVPDKVIYKGIKSIGLASNLEHIYTEPVEVLHTLVTTFNASLHILHVKKHEEDGHFAEMMLTRHYMHEFHPTVQFIESENIYEGLFSFVTNKALDLLIIMHDQHTSPEKSVFKKLVLHPEVPLMALQPL